MRETYAANSVKNIYLYYKWIELVLKLKKFISFWEIIYCICIKELLSQIFVLKAC